MYTLHWVIAARVLLFVNPDGSLYDHCVESIIPVKEEKLHDNLMKMSSDVEQDLLPTIIGMVLRPRIKSFVEVGWDVSSEAILILLAAAAAVATVTVTTIIVAATTAVAVAITDITHYGLTLTLTG